VTLVKNALATVQVANRPEIVGREEPGEDQDPGQKDRLDPDPLHASPNERASRPRGERLAHPVDMVGRTGSPLPRRPWMSSS
jgi:hypothetical protein